jgi:hypothetical protein
MMIRRLPISNYAGVPRIRWCYFIAQSRIVKGRFTTMKRGRSFAGLLFVLLIGLPLFAGKANDHVGHITDRSSNPADSIPSSQDNYHFKVGDESYTCIGGDEHNAPTCDSDMKWLDLWFQPECEVTMEDGAVITVSRFSSHSPHQVFYMSCLKLRNGESKEFHYKLGKVEKDGLQEISIVGGMSCLTRLERCGYVPRKRQYTAEPPRLTISPWPIVIVPDRKIGVHNIGETVDEFLWSEPSVSDQVDYCHSLSPEEYQQKRACQNLVAIFLYWNSGTITGSSGTVWTFERGKLKAITRVESAAPVLPSELPRSGAY